MKKNLVVEGYWANDMIVGKVRGYSSAGQIEREEILKLVQAAHQQKVGKSWFSSLYKNIGRNGSWDIMLMRHWNGLDFTKLDSN